MLSFKSWQLREEHSIPDATILQHIKIPLPSVCQSSDYDCGAAALRAIAEYFKVGPEDQKDFIKVVKAKKATGSSPENIIKAAKSFGLNVKSKIGMTLEELKDTISQGRPVICSMQAWGEKSDYPKDKSGHYIVAIGFDDGKIYFEDPSIHGKRGFLSFDEFDERWHDEESGGRKLKHFGITMWKDCPDKDCAYVLKKTKIK